MGISIPILTIHTPFLLGSPHIFRHSLMVVSMGSDLPIRNPTTGAIQRLAGVKMGPGDRQRWFLPLENI